MFIIVKVVKKYINIVNIGTYSFKLFASSFFRMTTTFLDVKAVLFRDLLFSNEFLKKHEETLCIFKSK